MPSLRLNARDLGNRPSCHPGRSRFALLLGWDTYATQWACGEVLRLGCLWRFALDRCRDIWFRLRWFRFCWFWLHWCRSFPALLARTSHENGSNETKTPSPGCFFLKKPGEGILCGLHFCPAQAAVECTAWRCLKVFFGSSILGTLDIWLCKNGPE